MLSLRSGPAGRKERLRHPSCRGRSEERRVGKECRSGGGEWGVKNNETRGYWRRRFPSFFFQAEDGIRDIGVTGVQTCALPISRDRRVVPGTDAAQYPDRVVALVEPHAPDLDAFIEERPGRAKGALAPPFLQGQIGRASCRERV